MLDLISMHERRIERPQIWLSGRSETQSVQFATTTILFQIFIICGLSTRISPRVGVQSRADAAQAESRTGRTLPNSGWDSLRLVPVAGSDEPRGLGLGLGQWA